MGHSGGDKVLSAPYGVVGGIDATTRYGVNEGHIYPTMDVSMGDSIGVSDLYLYEGMNYHGDPKL